MKISEIKPSATNEIVHAALIWIVLYSAEFVVLYFLNKTPGDTIYYMVTIGATVLLTLAVPQLGNNALVADIQEICLYDVFVQIFGLYLHLTGAPNYIFHIHAPNFIYATLAQLILVMKLARVVWPLATHDVQAGWPPFGILGYYRQWRRHKSGGEIPVKSGRFYAVAAGLCLTAVIVEGVAVLKGPPVSPILTVVFLGFYTRHIRDKLDEREKETEAAIAAKFKLDAQARINQAALANKAEIEQKNSELTAANEALEAANKTLKAKNTELQALYQERDATATALADRAIRLGDAMHHIKHTMSKLIFQAKHLSEQAEAASVRETASQMKTDLAEAGARMVRLIEDANIQSPVATPPKVALTAQALCDEFFARHNPLATECAVDLQCRVRGNAALPLRCDQTALTGILDNLLVNAITYSDDDARVHLTFYGAQDGWWVRVADSGFGIADVNTPDRAANFMTLLDKVAAAKQSGSGVATVDTEALGSNRVGLHSVYRLCRDLGVTMQLQSVPDKGTVFRFKLPVA
jgi:signal transduction histidine kinase